MLGLIPVRFGVPAAVLACIGFGQSVITVSGTVYDPSNAVLLGAAVALTSGNQEILKTTTDSKGEFGFAVSNPGRYELRVEFQGFKPERTRINLRSGSADRLKIVLALANLQDSISVDGDEARLLANAQENLSVVRIDAEQLQSLPMLNGNAIDMLVRLLSPAAVGAGGPTVVVDGLPADSARNLPLSEIREIKINSNPYSAEFARPGRGRIEISTKSGSAKYHGSLDSSLRDFRLDARNAFAAQRPPEQRLQLEGNLSGPLVKGGKDTFSLTASRTRDDLEPPVFAFGLAGPIQENAQQIQTSTYISAQLARRLEKNAVSLRYTHFDWSNTGVGSGGYVLPTAASDSSSHYHQIYSSYQATISPQMVNEFFIRARGEISDTGSRLPGVPKIVVTDAFVSGGSQSNYLSTTNQMEFADNLSWSHGRHLLKAGVNVPAWGRMGITDRSNSEGTYYFSSLLDYSQLRPFSFTKQTGDGHAVLWQKQAGGFVQDEIKLRPNLSVAAGLRYEWQNYGAGYRNFAPRLFFAYGLGKASKTVVRGGAGFFYDAVPAGEIMQTLLLNGSRLRQVLLLNPNYPDPFVVSSGAALPPNLARFGPAFRSPYMLQYSVAIERELSKSLSLTATYTGMRGVDLYRSRDVNAPVPPLYATRPDSSVGTIQEFESSGSFRSQALQTTLRGNFSRYFKGMAIYELGHGMNDTDGIGSFPANSWDLRGEWARASSDVRHFVYLYGTLTAGKYFRFGVIFSANSGKPYTMTTGLDSYHDGMTSARPSGVSRNSLQGTPTATLDLRWSRDLAIRPSKKDGPRAVIGVDAFNLFNHTNFASFSGNLSSPFFGRPVSAGPARRVQLSFGLRF